MNWISKKRLNSVLGLNFTGGRLSAFQGRTRERCDHGGQVRPRPTSRSISCIRKPGGIGHEIKKAP